LSQFFDGTLLVARGGKTNYTLANRAVEHLRDVNAQLLGLVINGLNLKKYADYYHEYYYYGSQEETRGKTTQNGKQAF
jgi:succinoglycan biosynthesis transport protein ExoP